VGWNQREMQPRYKKIADALKGIDVNTLEDICKKILTDNQYRESESYLKDLEITGVDDFEDLSGLFRDLRAKAQELDLKKIDQEIPFEFQEKIRTASQASHEITFEPYCSKLIIKSSQNKLIVPNMAFFMALEALPVFRAIKKFNDVFIAVYERLRSRGQINFSKAEKFYDDVLKLEGPSALKKVFEDELSVYLKEIGKDSEENKKLFNKFISDKSWKSDNNGSGKSPGRADLWNSPVLTAFGTSHSNQGFICEVVDILAGATDDVSVHSLLNRCVNLDSVSGPKNLIVYGAPGTGKSFYINNLLKNATSIRTVFHSETQNSDFVGSLKPVTNVEGKVTYQFVAGPFVKSFVAAVKEPNKKIHLVIEEINRANAAAVFGEIFQLLDRDTSGRSEYEIQPDDLLSTYLYDALGSTFSGLIYIPSNLIINATMNSSDQGVYPLDSAFKRRWSFKYMPIDFQDCPRGAIDLDGRRITWDILAKSINEVLSTEYAHLEEDRFIGPWFLNQDEVRSQFSKAIESKLFTYLWNDVLRHQEKGKIFNDQDIVSFSDLIKIFNRQSAGEPIYVFSELVHQAFDRNIAKVTPVVDETVVDDRDE
jgi:GTPase SAR1 family protein